MRLLLDTHIWIWYIEGNERLPKKHRALIQDSQNTLFVSTISVWEMYLLSHKGKVIFSQGVEEWVKLTTKELVLQEIPIASDILKTARQYLTIHNDPADLFIASTAIVNGLTLLSCDDKFLEFPKLKFLQ